MNDTEFRRAVLGLCRSHPEFREKLAAELRRPVREARARTAGQRDGYMVWQSLRKMIDRVPELAAMVHDDADELEDWQQAKLIMAAEYVDAVYDSIRYALEDDSF